MDELASFTLHWTTRDGRTARPSRRQSYRPAALLGALAGLLLLLALQAHPARAAATLTVTTTADTIAADGACSLREAITAANADATVNECVHDGSAGTDTIAFGIPSGGPQTIALSSPLPALGNGIIIDGQSQPGFAGTLLITLDGSAAGPAANGLQISGSNNIVQGLVISNFAGVGIQISGATAVGNSVQGNYIGTDASGAAAAPNGLGVAIRFAATNNQVGGTTPAQRNVISGNSQDGIRILDAGTSGNVIAGNYIGTDANGAAALGNGFRGVEISNATDNSIGGSAPGAGNVISGNGSQGISIGLAGTTGNTIQGNAIGTDATGSVAIPNRTGGISIFAPDTTVGGTSTAARNLISGNSGPGVEVFGADATGNTILGNAIGTDASGSAALPNSAGGVLIREASANAVGGADAGSGNLISGNGASGVVLDGPNTSANLVRGNYIGADATGQAALPNAQAGVAIQNGAHQNSVGGTAPGAGNPFLGNLISGNGAAGVAIGGASSSGNLVQGNFIGTDEGGTRALANGTHGIEITNAPNNIIGGTTRAARNVISGNAQYGVYINGASATGNLVQGNAIGVNMSDAAALANGRSGVWIRQAALNVIGGAASGAENIISGNADNGVLLTGAAQNTIAGNVIGADVGGSLAIGNQLSGVQIESGSINNQIGGTSAASRNIISGNAQYGVRIVNGDVLSNTVQGNFIGTDRSGGAAVANGLAGVAVAFEARGTLVGGTAPGAGNLISGNGQHGVVIARGASGTLVQGNAIGTDASGTAAIPNQSHGVRFETGATGNTVGGTSAASRNIISGNGEAGVFISASDDNTVQGNYIGTDASGTAAVANGFEGVTISYSANSQIGGAAPGAGNLISGNGANGIAVNGDADATRFNQILGNYIGTDASGNALLPNAGNGIAVTGGATGTQIGGVAPGARNVIGGGANAGVLLRDPAVTSTKIQGNYLGVGADGTTALPNSYGVMIMLGSSGNQIGGADAGAGNIISGNSRYGVWLDGAGTSGNIVQGNYIGSDASGVAALGNGDSAILASDGILISNGATGNTIGGITAGAGNLISANAQHGVHIAGATTTANQVQGNLIGTDASGTAALGNYSYGVFIEGAPGNLIGGTDPGARNIISGSIINGGVLIWGVNATGNIVQGNYIGTDASGMVALPNNNTGVMIRRGASGNTIGGTTPGARNIISGNRQEGVYLGVDLPDDQADSNLVQGNYIGVDASGAAALGNTTNGVVVHNGTNNTIGGDVAGAGNVIAGNTDTGIILGGVQVTGNRIQGNSIGVSANGSAAVANSQGVLLLDTSNNLIGGTSGAARNIISGNTNSGVAINGPDAAGNTIAGNYIGTDASGTRAIPNATNTLLVAASGVHMVNGAHDNTVGGGAAGASNLISGNKSVGVGLYSDGNTVSGNSIGTDAAGTQPLGNTSRGIHITGSNNMIGGATPELRNLIAGNDNGILIEGAAAANNHVFGNYIGTDVSGTTALPNLGDGIEIRASAHDNQIGGAAAGERNLISGNVNRGIVIYQGATGNLIQANYIGLDLSGAAALANRNQGLMIQDAADNRVEGNAISGNGNHGVWILDPGATGNLIRGNAIGTDATGSAGLGNGTAGVAISSGASANIIGGDTAAERNIISGNNEGLFLVGAVDTQIRGNYIGTTAAGTAALANGFGGIRLQQSSGTQIVGNLISGNGGPDGNGAIWSPATTPPDSDTLIQNNRIGTDAAGATAIPNSSGIGVVDGASNITITDNQIAGNSGNGITVSSSGATVSGVVIRGNRIGTSADGGAALPNADGVVLTTSGAGAVGGTLIGGSAPGEENLISGNAQDGIQIGGNSAGTVIQGNLIGTSADGAQPLPNGGAGVTIDGATGTLIGGSGAGERNVISGNAGAGVAILGDTAAGNRLRANLIFGNGGLGIDLGDNGPTANDAGDGDGGPNGLQNSPTIDLASEGLADTSFSGSLAGLPNTSIDIDLYSSPACNASGQGDGLYYLASASASTDAAGAGSFSASIPVTGMAGTWVTAVASAADGSSSEFSACAPVLTNDLWLNALPLDLRPGAEPDLRGAAVSQQITQPYQERWYRFPAQPGGQVRIRLSGQPGSMVTLHRDLQKVYAQLALPQSAAALAAGELPGRYMPGRYMPENVLPGRYMPGSFLPGRYMPGSSLSEGSLPGRYMPGSFLPGRYMPGRYMPGRYMPGRYMPELYSGAIYQSLMAYSALPDVGEQVIEQNTWDLSEDLYVRVAGPESPAAPFTLSVELRVGLCSAVYPVPSSIAEPIAGAQPAGGQRDTLIIWDSARFRTGDPSGNIDGLTARLAAFAARPDIDGAVIDLAAIENGAAKYPRVAAANAQADKSPSCAAAKNIVAEEIRAVIGRYREANQDATGATSLRYIILAGHDEVIPFFRYPDNGGLANEQEYYPPVADQSPANAALRQGRVLGQDGYGAALEVWRGSYLLPLPDLAVGRLVGTAADVARMLDAYEGAGGVVTPRSALVTGYDFIADAAEQVQEQLSLGLNPAGCASAPGGCVTPRGLIVPASAPPGSQSNWTADDLRSALLGARNDLVFLNGHFDAGAALAADYSSSVYASELLSAPADLSNALIFGLGCHSGYNIPPSAALTGASPDPDWPEAFARRGATFVAATGFAYGDTELTEYGERLMVSLSRQLRTGREAVPIGAALLQAKRQYLEQKASLSGLDDKTLAQFVLFGLPMLQVNMPGQRLEVDTDPAIVSGATLVADGPGRAFGLQVGQPVGAGAPDPAAEVVARPGLERVDVPLTNVSTNTAITASYLRGPGGVVAAPAEPVLPLARYTASVDGQILRGVGFRRGSYTDLAGIVPLTSAPTTEQPRTIDGFISPTFYPGQAWGTNYFGAATGGATRLMVMPGQYRSNSLSSIDGTLRRYSAMSFRLYYLDADWAAQDDERRLAAIGPAPEIVAVEARDLGGGRAEARASVVSAGSAGVQEVWLTWTDLAAPGEWRSIDMEAIPGDPIGWRTPGDGVELPATAVFMVQAATGTGLVALNTNGGAYYAVAPTNPPTPPPPPAATTLAPGDLPGAVAFGQAGSFSARLADSSGPLAGRQALLTIGAQQHVATSDADGWLRFGITLAQPPGQYAGRIAFAGDEGLAGSTLDFSLSVVKDRSSLALSPSAISTAIGQPTRLVAILSDSAGLPIADRSVVFVASGPAGTFARSVKTGLDGQAVLGVVDWPAGSYEARAYFSGNIPLPGGAVSVEDQLYEAAASAAAQLTISAGVPETTISAGPPDPSASPGATFSLSGSDDLTPAGALRFECALDGGPFRACGSTQSYSGLKNGQHIFLARAIDADGFVDPSPASWTWTAVIAGDRFPRTNPQDKFNRPDGPLRGYWAGDRTGYYLRAGVVHVRGGGPLLWNARAYGANQEAYITLVRLGDRGGTQGLLLKVQDPRRSWRRGAILVNYDAEARTVQVRAYQPGMASWERYPRIPLDLHSGDQFGARARSDGSVQIFRNGELVGTVKLSAASQAFFNGRGGQIGLWFYAAGQVRLDNFGGGNIR